MELDRSKSFSQVAIIGAGFGGLGAAIRLRQAGFRDFIIFERAESVGGVWRDNRYPGAACDVESHLYSFSFAPNPAWTRSYSPQPEIWAYLQRCAVDFGVWPQIRFQHTVREVLWEAEARVWRLVTSQGDYQARWLVMATGALSEPAIPALPGLERFAGPAFHSAQWEARVDLRGRRVAVVGTGASAVQFVPALQPQVAQLTVFQRTAPWVLPRLNRSFSASERWWFQHVPLARRAVRAALQTVRELSVVAFQHPRLMKFAERSARQYLKAAVADPDLRAKLTPRYTLGCKRVLLSSDYYPALTQPNVALVTEGLAEVRPHSLVTQSGHEYPAEALIFGTGFRVTDFPFSHHVRGRAGQTLAAAWAGSPQAYLGTTVAGFPNLFLLQGPNTGLGHTSVLLMLEAQLDHLLNAVRYLMRHDLSVCEPRAEAQAAFVRAVDAQMRGTVWVAGGCQSWYLDATGRNSTLWPGTTGAFRRRVAGFAPNDYHLS